jgi:hypothetical protein
MTPLCSRERLQVTFTLFASHAALDLDFFSIDDFTSINFEPLAELKVEKESLKEKSYLRNRQALQQALVSAANVDSDLEDDLRKFFWSGDANQDSRLNLAEFRKIIQVDRIDMEEAHVQALVSSLFQVHKSCKHLHHLHQYALASLLIWDLFSSWISTTTSTSILKSFQKF